MADLGAATLLPVPDPFLVTAYQPLITGIHMGTATLLPLLDLIPVSDYFIGGTLPTGPVAPTYGQLWPRGNP